MPDDIDAEFLFPTPSAPPSTLSPYHWPGVSPASTQVLSAVLTENHKRWHIFFNDRGFHNHTAHHVLAIWALGADAAIIRAAYENDLKSQRPAFKSPEPITDHNYEKHLGDEKFYDAYVNFFTDYVRKNGTHKMLETFIFSKKYNTEQMAMLNRFLSGLVHPMIHTGYGAEFNLPGMLIEGIAQTCVHRGGVGELLPQSFFDSVHSIPETAPSSFLGGTTQKIAQFAAQLTQGSSSFSSHNVHALTILARLMADSRLSLPDDPHASSMIQKTIAKHSQLIRDYASQWTIDVRKAGEIERKVEEIAWMNVVMYGIAGWTWAQQVKQGREGEFNADFFLMHLVTSAAFIPSLLARIGSSLQHQVLLLRSYFAVSLSWYIARARPKLDVRAFFLSSTATPHPLPINTLPTPHEDALQGPDKIQTQVPDPWLPLISTTIVHPDDHLSKAIRALASWGSKFGSTPAGTFSGPSSSSAPDVPGGPTEPSSEPAASKNAIKTELPGAEYLDGTLFVRVAGLTVARLGRVGQGEAPAKFWDRTGFFEDPEVAATVTKQTTDKSD